SFLRPGCTQRVKGTQDLSPLIAELYTVGTAVSPHWFALDIPGPFQTVEQTGDVLRRDQSIFADLRGSDPRLSSQPNAGERQPLLRGQPICPGQPIANLSPYVCQSERTQHQVESRGFFCHRKALFFKLVDISLYLLFLSVCQAIFFPCQRQTKSGRLPGTWIRKPQQTCRSGCVQTVNI